MDEVESVHRRDAVGVLMAEENRFYLGGRPDNREKLRRISHRYVGVARIMMNENQGGGLGAGEGFLQPGALSRPQKAFRLVGGQQRIEHNDPPIGIIQNHHVASGNLLVDAWVGREGTLKIRPVVVVAYRHEDRHAIGHGADQLPEGIVVAAGSVNVSDVARHDADRGRRGGNLSNGLSHVCVNVLAVPSGGV